MKPYDIIHKYYAEFPELEELLIKHSRQVAGRALTVAYMHPEWNLDLRFIYEAAMLHDIGIIQTNAAGIHCHGTEPYICHGRLGAEMLRKEGLEAHARVAERHTGTGLTAKQITTQQLHLPALDFFPETLEEQIICYADKFYSKNKIDMEKSYDHALRSMEKFGSESTSKLKEWMLRFEGVKPSRKH